MLVKGIPVASEMILRSMDEINCYYTITAQDNTQYVHIIWDILRYPWEDKTHQLHVSDDDIYVDVW